MVTAACQIADAPHMTIPDKFSALRGHFGAREPTREETEQDILDIRRKNDVSEPELPRPRVPVFLLTVAEAQMYMQLLVDWIVRVVLKVKQQEFRRWPQTLSVGTLVPATKFDLWDSDVEDVLPRQSYFGRNKFFSHLFPHCSN